jgi:hypothetical protein
MIATQDIEVEFITWPEPDEEPCISRTMRQSPAYFKMLDAAHELGYSSVCKAMRSLLVDQHVSHAETEERLSCSRATLYKWTTRLGLSKSEGYVLSPLKRRALLICKGLGYESIQDGIQAMLKQGMSTKDISHKLTIDGGDTLEDWCGLWGILIPDRCRSQYRQARTIAEVVERSFSKRFAQRKRIDAEVFDPSYRGSRIVVQAGEHWCGYCGCDGFTEAGVCCHCGRSKYAVDPRTVLYRHEYRLEG